MNLVPHYLTGTLSWGQPQRQIDRHFDLHPDPTTSHLPRRQRTAPRVRGADTASYAGSTARVLVLIDTGLGILGDSAGDTLSGIKNLTGGLGADTLIGDAAANVIIGGAGINDLWGQGGNDVLNGGDVLFGQGGDDTLNGGSGADQMFGGTT